MTTKKKLSRREREEQAVTRRYMLIGGGAVAVAAAAGIGMTMMPPSFPVVAGKATLDERIAQAGIQDHLLKLSGDGEKTDLVVIGNTECVFCQKFVKDGLSDLVALAKEKGLTLSYAAIGGGASSLGSTRLLSCFARGSAAEPEKILREVYAAGDEMRTGASFEDTARRYGEMLGVSEADIEACLAENPLDATARIQATHSAFDIAGTPMFYVASAKNPSTIRWFSGFSGAGAMVRQLENALELG